VSHGLGLRRLRGMNAALWTVTALVSVVFVFSGTVKSLLPRERLIASGQRGIGPFPMPVVRLVAVSELVAVFGLFAPWLSGTARVLTPLAAMGLAAVMYGAAISHASLREPKQTGAVVGILVLCAFIAAGRLEQMS
jgi:uncharacterized membrane protein YphA (DoxX/SURF4 family)